MAIENYLFYVEKKTHSDDDYDEDWDYVWKKMIIFY